MNMPRPSRRSRARASLSGPDRRRPETQAEPEPRFDSLAASAARAAGSLRHGTPGPMPAAARDSKLCNIIESNIKSYHGILV